MEHLKLPCLGGRTLAIIAVGDEQQCVWDKQCISNGLVCSEEEKN